MANQDIIKKSIAESMKSLVREKQVEEISVSDICQLGNINRRTFYRYFSDKFEVIEWIHFNDFLLHIQVPDQHGLYYFMAASVHLVMEDKKYYINALKYKGQNSFRNYVSRHLCNLCYQDFRACFSSDELYYLYFNHSVETAFDFLELYLTTKPDLTEQALLQAFRDLFYKPGKRYAELLEQEYQHPGGGTSYQAKEPSRVQNSSIDR